MNYFPYFINNIYEIFIRVDFVVWDTIKNIAIITSYIFNYFIFLEYSGCSSVEHACYDISMYTKFN